MNTAVQWFKSSYGSGEGGRCTAFLPLSPRPRA